jgi:hypothetical protein
MNIMKAGKVIILVGVIGALGFGAWLYLKKRKEKTLVVPAGTTPASTGTTGSSAPGTTPTSTSTPTLTPAPLSAGAEICNVPPEITALKGFNRQMKTVQYLQKVATPLWEAQGRGMDLGTFILQLREEHGCPAK